MQLRRRNPRRRGLPRPQQMAKNRTELLDAAGRVFRELGYYGSSLDLIADRAGFSKGAVYSHFASKADLFLSLLEARIESRVSAELAAVGRRGVTDIVALGREVFAASRSDARWQIALLEFRMLAARDPKLRARYARVHRRALEGVAATLRVLFDAMGFEPDLPLESLAVAGFVVDVGGFLEDLARPGALSVEQAAVFFSRIVGAPFKKTPSRR
jgi:AcrR family transcriptional regulator